MKTVAIIGASNDRSKYGNKSVRAHLGHGYQVFPVNPREAQIEGLLAYKSITDVPVRPERISVGAACRAGETFARNRGQRLRRTVVEPWH